MRPAKRAPHLESWANPTGLALPSTAESCVVGWAGITSAVIVPKCTLSPLKTFLAFQKSGTCAVSKCVECRCCHLSAVSTPCFTLRSIVSRCIALVWQVTRQIVRPCCGITVGLPVQPGCSAFRRFALDTVPADTYRPSAAVYRKAYSGPHRGLQ